MPGPLCSGCRLALVVSTILSEREPTCRTNRTLSFLLSHFIDPSYFVMATNLHLFFLKELKAKLSITSVSLSITMLGEREIAQW